MAEPGKTSGNFQVWPKTKIQTSQKDFGKRVPGEHGLFTPQPVYLHQNQLPILPSKHRLSTHRGRPNSVIEFRPSGFFGEL